MNIEVLLSSEFAVKHHLQKIQRLKIDSNCIFVNSEFRKKI